MLNHAFTRRSKMSVLPKTLNINLSNKKLINFDSCENNLSYELVVDIDPQELGLKMNEVILVDVRQTEEYHGELGHIPGALSIVLDTLPDHLQMLPKDKTVVFVCRSGSRSARATEYANENGYTHVFNLKGGMILWNELHLPTEE